jgi:hypothetical protein
VGGEESKKTLRRAVSRYPPPITTVNFKKDSFIFPQKAVRFTGRELKLGASKICPSLVHFFAIGGKR